MSAYTIAEIAGWLVLAAGLGFALGWLVRSLQVARRDARLASSRVGAPATAPVPEPNEPADDQRVRPGPFPGSAIPADDGAPPTPGYTVKAKTRSMIYHTPSSPAYARTVADTWFTTEDAAVAAGFRKPRNA